MTRSQAGDYHGVRGIAENTDRVQVPCLRRSEDARLAGDRVDRMDEVGEPHDALRVHRTAENTQTVRVAFAREGKQHPAAVSGECSWNSLLPDVHRAAEREPVAERFASSSQQAELRQSEACRQLLSCAVKVEQGIERITIRVRAAACAAALPAAPSAVLAAAARSSALQRLHGSGRELRVAKVWRERSFW
jgi:hypothetical protein